MLISRFGGAATRGFRAFSSGSLWLPFEEGREWARKQELHSYREWAALSAAGRPRGIPARPDRIYAGQFSSWYDWLGYSSGRLCTQPTEDEYRAQAETVQGKHVGFHKDGVDEVEAFLRNSNRGFNLFRMPNFLPVDLLVQVPSRTNGTDLWAGIAIKSAQQNSRRRYANFHVSKNWGDEYCCICLDRTHGDVFLLPPNYVSASPGSTVAMRRGGDGRYDRCFVPWDDLAERVEDLCTQGPLKSLGWWLAETCVSRRERKLNAAHFGMWSLLYEPTGININFLPSGNTPHNLELNGKRVLQRIAARRPLRSPRTRVGYNCEFHRDVGSNKRLPFSVTDGLDFLCAPVLNGSLAVRGCYLLSSSVLVSKQLITTRETRGVHDVNFYPPDVTPSPNTRLARAQEWQLPYYVDLEDSSAAALLASREKFLGILEGV